MKKTAIFYSLIFFSFMFFSSCKDFLDIIPTGKKIPETYADFEALIKDEYGVHFVPVRQAVTLLNDHFLSNSTLSFEKLADINYHWRESEDRKVYNNADEGTYYQGYASISTANLLIEYAPSMVGSTEQQVREITATARMIRAISYFSLVNYYAAPYATSTASQLKSVPLIESANVDAPHIQVSIQELYDYMIADIDSALPDLPQEGQTTLHPAKGAAYALLARIYLQMENYEAALDNAEKALAVKNTLYDWVTYYTNQQAIIEDPTDYTLKATPLNHQYVENYYFRHGNAANFASSEASIRVDRARRFEDGDAKFGARWKLRTVGVDTYYASTMTGYHNTQGLTTVEVYLIKAECLARLGRIDEAMETLNAVRITRILPDHYEAMGAATTADAVKLIQATKQNELILSIVPFADRRRLNKDPEYATTLQKEEGGNQLSLSPQSHLWIMPFPLGAIENPGNGQIEQNVEK